MKKEEETNSGRRNFIKNTAIAGASFMIFPRHVLGGKGFLAPSDRLIVAGVGVGGKGEGDISAFYKSFDKYKKVISTLRSVEICSHTSGMLRYFSHRKP